MSHVPHELAEEFPDKQDKLHALKTTNSHFARLADSYHEINRRIHRAESEVEPMDDLALEDIKKERLKLKDEIAGMLAE
ncbi:MAG: DUF465 domain-containing protein [Hyphomicrobiaceae bacterium]|nr:DUF465 domain-containing protein [Hyphomicrobiaceae bacterium]